MLQNQCAIRSITLKGPRHTGLREDSLWPGEPPLRRLSCCCRERDRAGPGSNAGPRRSHMGTMNVPDKDCSHTWKWRLGARLCTWAMCVAPASPIELNARLRITRFLLADVVVERAKPIRRAPSSPMRLFLSDRWVRLGRENKRCYYKILPRLYRTDIQSKLVCLCLCVCVCVCVCVCICLSEISHEYDV